MKVLWQTKRKLFGGLGYTHKVKVRRAKRESPPQGLGYTHKVKVSPMVSPLSIIGLGYTHKVKGNRFRRTNIDEGLGYTHKVKDEICMFNLDCMHKI